MTNNTRIKELVLNKVILYIADTKLAGPGIALMLGELEAIYVGMLDSNGTVWSTHITPFAELLLAWVPGLLKEWLSNKLRVLFDSAVQNNTQNLKITLKIFLNDW